jgi:hypothetical protein
MAGVGVARVCVLNVLLELRAQKGGTSIDYETFPVKSLGLEIESQVRALVWLNVNDPI